jgi:tRNA pseudouridine55 synthase
MQKGINQQTRNNMKYTLLISMILFNHFLSVVRSEIIPHSRKLQAAFVTNRGSSFQSSAKHHKSKKAPLTTARFSASADDQSIQENSEVKVPIHLAEGLCAVYKPLDWTSNDVVSFIRGMLEREARNRGAKLAKRRSRKSKNKIKVGHGGTLDPLATGVLVIGVGSGTKDLQKYLKGSKRYTAGVELGFETETLDMEGNRTKELPFEHVTAESVEKIIPEFTGKIMQKPPIYSALKKNGKRLYEQARNGKTEDDIEIEAREVEVYDLKFLPEDKDGKTMPCFGLNVECGGGTYIRSLVRDMGNSLDTAATMTSLERTQQGPFTLNDVIAKDEWSPETIYAAVAKYNDILADESTDE